MKKGYKQMNEAEFNRIKALINANVLPKVKVAELVGRSPSAISTISRSKDFDEYKSIINAYLEASKARRTTVKAAKAIIDEPSEDDKLEQSLVELAQGEPTKEVDPLARIADAMERLATAWESTPNKKKFF